MSAPDLSRIHASFAAQPIMASIGAALSSVEPGAVSIALPPNPDTFQQHGFVHGGVVTAIADSAAGYAAMTMIPDGMEVLTIELKTNFLRPARGLLWAQGRVIRAGRQTVVAMTDVFCDPDGARKHVAMLTATMAVVEHPEVTPARGSR
ncbi:MAG: PaaI family thioesterase [Pseudomonadota bacterium]